MRAAFSVFYGLGYVAHNSTLRLCSPKQLERISSASVEVDRLGYS
jgi:hypothetical protein